MPIRSFKAQNIVACFDRPAGVPEPSFADTFNIDHPQNAPAKNPELHLDKITFHSKLFQYEVAAGPVDVPITHPALATKTTTIGIDGGGGGWGISFAPTIGVNITGDERQTDLLLFAHNLGVVPKFMVSLAGRRVPDGYVIQDVAGAYRRRVAVWANTTGIYLRDSAAAGGSACPAITLTYRVMVFRDSSPVPAKPLLGGGPGLPLVLARGVIDSSKKYLRRTGAGDTPFAQNLGRTLDCNSGRLASASGGVVVAESGYAGGLVAPPFIQVGVD